MRGQTIKMAGAIVGMLVVFIVFLWVLSVVLGSPDCDELANNTAYNLKVAIDQVSSDSFPTVYDNNPVSGQYASAVVRLCQEDYVFSKLADQGKTDNPLDQAYSWILKLSGGEPQYKIYYEIFPEEGGTWKESYPWNGGAASTLLFWGALRGVSFGIDRLSPYIGTALNARTIYKIFKWLKGTSEVASTVSQAVDNFALEYGTGSGMKDFMARYVTSSFGIRFDSENSTDTAGNTIFFDSNRRDSMEVVKSLNEKSTENIIAALADSNFIRKDASGNWLKVGYRIAINNQELPMVFETKELMNNKWVVTGHYAIAVRQEGGGALDASIVDWKSEDQNNIIQVALTKTSNGYSIGTYDTSNYALMIYKPNELVRDMYNQLMQSSDDYDRQKASQLKSYWYWDEDASSAETFTDATETNYGNDIYSMGYNKAKRALQSFEKQGVLTDSTVLHSGDISGMLNGFREAAFAGDSDSQSIQNAILTIFSDKRNGVYDRTCQVLKGTESCTLSIREMFDALQSAPGSVDKGLYNPNVGVGGIMMLWSDYSINVDVKIMDLLISDTSFRSRSSANDNLMLTQVQPFNKAGLQDSEILDIYHGQLDWLSQSGHTIDNLAEGMGKIYLKRLANGLSQFQSNPDRYEWAANDLGFIMGLYKQEASTQETQLPSAYQKGVTVSGIENKTSISFGVATAVGFAVKNVVFLNIKELITPSSGIAKGFMLQTTEGCLGNSLCVYSHGTMLNPEKPMYLNENAKGFTVKLSRPVSPLINIAGIDGFLKQVPSNPRFYVVSPCFGMAKVWKTMNEGRSTIFIKIDKYDMGDDASNYCYADETLINEYGMIWFASTAGEIVEGFASGGLKTAAQQSVKLTLKQTIGKYILKLDPVMLAQGIAEAAISWPGAPFKSLTYETMVGQSGNNLINNIKTESGMK